MSCLLCPRKRKSRDAGGTSVMCQEATFLAFSGSLRQFDATKPMVFLNATTFTSFIMAKYRTALSDDVATLVGIDHGFSFPMRYFEGPGLKTD